MSKYDRIKRKIIEGSGNLTFEEITSLLNHFGYEQDEKGRTSGSRIRFYHDRRNAIILHKPHPRKTMLSYQIKQIKRKLEDEGLL